MDASTFADQVVESLYPWPPNFTRKPLLRTLIEAGIAWAFADWERGDFITPNGTGFAVQAMSVIEHDLLGRCDHLDNGLLFGTPDLKALIETRIALHFDRVLAANADNGAAAQTVADTGPYEMLGVPTTATPDEIHEAYLKQAKRYHPDQHAEDLAATERLKAINGAYEALSKTRPNGGAQS